MVFLLLSFSYPESFFFSFLFFLSNEQPTFPVHRVTGAVFVVCLDLFVGVKFQRRPRGSPPVTMEVAFIFGGKAACKPTTDFSTFLYTVILSTNAALPTSRDRCIPASGFVLLLLTGIVQEYHYG